MTDDEPKYDLESQTWDKRCPCITAQQLDPDCPYHGEKDDRPGREADRAVIQIKGRSVGSEINSSGRVIR